MIDNKKKLVRTIVTLVADLVIAGVVSYSRYQNPPSSLDSISIFHALADGFFPIGFLNFGFGLLLWIGTTGFFDIFGYSAKAILNFFIPRRFTMDKGGYYEYKVKKEEKRKNSSIPFETIWIGVGMMVLGIIFNILA